MGRRPSAGPFNSYIYNNTVYVKEDLRSIFSFEHYTEGILIANNIFCLLGGMEDAPYGKQPYPPDAKIENAVFMNNLYRRENTLPETIMIHDSKPLIGNPGFANPGGYDPKDYIPGNIELIKDKGIKIEKIPGDSIGLKIGLEVETDFLGNPVTGLPDLGAIEIQDN